MPSPERPFALAPAPRLSSRIRVFADYPPLSRRIGVAPDAYLIQRLCVFYKLGDRREHLTDQELHMRQLRRLLRYLVPYCRQFIPSIFLLAGVGLRDACRGLSKTYYGNADLDYCDGYRTSAVSNVKRNGGIPAAVLHFCVYRRGCNRAGP